MAEVWSWTKHICSTPGHKTDRKKEVAQSTEPFEGTLPVIQTPFIRPSAKLGSQTFNTRVLGIVQYPNQARHLVPTPAGENNMVEDDRVSITNTTKTPFLNKELIDEKGAFKT